MNHDVRWSRDWRIPQLVRKWLHLLFPNLSKMPPTLGRLELSGHGGKCGFSLPLSILFLTPVHLPSRWNGKHKEQFEVPPFCRSTRSSSLCVDGQRRSQSPRQGLLAALGYKWSSPVPPLSSPRTVWRCKSKRHPGTSVGQVKHVA